nr:hypothetical protein Iba_chr03dCG8580 [Ipomoea batatas]
MKPGQGNKLGRGISPFVMKPEWSSLCHRRTATIFAAFPDPIQQFVTLHVHSLSSLPPCDADYHCFSPAEQEYRRTGRSILGICPPKLLMNNDAPTLNNFRKAYLLQ